MATDLTTDAQRDTIITSSLRKLGILKSGGTGTANQVSDAAHALNLIVKQYDSDPKLKMFLGYTVKSVAVSANDSSKALAAGVLNVEGCYYKKTSDGSVRPLKPMSQKEYMESLASEGTADVPEFFYVSEEGDRSATVTMYFSPKIAAAGTLYYWSRDKIDLFDNSTDQTDFPDSWVRFLEWQLAADLAWEYGKGLEEIMALQQIADRAYMFATEQQVMVTDHRKTEQPNAHNDRTF